VTETRATLVALGAPADASLGALRAELEALDTLAARTAALQAQLTQAEQQHAAATAVLAERTATCETSARAVLDAEAAAAAAVATAEKARAAFEDEWRRQLPPELGPDVTAVPELMSEVSRVGHELAATLGHARATLEAARADVARAEQLRSDASTYRRNSEVASDLGLELQANRFVAFIQREAMQALATDAGGRMLQLSRDRYRLEADGDEFVVVDRLNGDERRSVRTLSGGETFLASLALALALSERLPELSGRGGALSLESLFLDEGFGSLDAESLSVAIEGLELLATGSRMIGVISHVPEVAERLPERIEVVKTGGASTVRDGR
jgi:exonuclease SbcC